MRIKLFFLMLISVLFLEAGSVKYASATKALFETEDSASLKGKLMPTVKMDILEEKNGKLKIKVEGYIKGNVTRIVYFVKGKRIMSAVLSKGSKFKFQKLSTSKDANGNEWTKISFVAYTKSDNLSDSLTDLYGKAKKLYSTKCAICHPAHASEDRVANQWPSVLKGMIKRTPMTKEDGYLVTQYLQKHAKDMK